MLVGLVDGRGLLVWPCNTIYGADSQVLKTPFSGSILSATVMQLLQMIAMPPVFASILSAVARLHNASQLGKIGFLDYRHAAVYYPYRSAGGCGWSPICSD